MSQNLVRHGQGTAANVSLPSDYNLTDITNANNVNINVKLLFHAKTTKFVIKLGA